MDPVNEPSVWLAEKYRRSDEWVFEFTEHHIAELNDALNGVRNKSLGSTRFTKDDFPLPMLGSVLDAQRDELEIGRGFVLFRGIPVDRYDLDELTALYWGIGAHIGEGIFQNSQGDLVGHVTDHGKKFEGDDPYKHNIRAYTTTVEIPPHTDSCDLVGLLCVRPARLGGGSAVVSSTALYNEFLATRPDLLGPLYKGFYTDIAQMTSRFAEIIPPYHRRGNRIPFAAIRWPDFGDQPSVGRPFGQICRHSDTPLLSFSPRRRCPRPTPGRVLVADHRSGSGFSGTVPSAPPPRPIGT